MRRLALIVCLAAASGLARAQTGDDAELQKAYTNAANSPQGILRELEAYLARYPQTPRRAEIEDFLLRAAIESKDVDRVARYGEAVLARQPSDVTALENTVVAELKLGGKTNGERALGHAQEFEQLVRTMTAAPQAGREEARRQLDRSRGLARAYLFEARAEGQLDRVDKAVAFAEKSYDEYPTAESAREAGWWLDQAHRPAEAVDFLAAAFVMPDANETAADRGADRLRLGEVYKAWKGAENGLGDRVLAAYDRVTAQLAARKLALAAFDPNVQANDPMQFTLSALDGPPLKLAGLLGKVVVMDFWATWCGPCRTQHPIYEEVKRKFAGRGDVVFLAIDAGDERGQVEPFVKAQGWSRSVYFEDGLAAALRVESLPTTIIIDKKGHVAERMKGFVPALFGEQLSERIQAALGDPAHGG